MSRVIPSFVLALAIVPASAAWAVSSISLNFNGGAGGIADTGFDSAYNPNSSGYTLAGGSLTIKTLPGDTYGQYETDPDTAQNIFYSVIDPGTSTTIQTTVTVSGLSQNFEGGGLFMGTDEDHYARLDIFHNSFLSNPSGPIGVELLRENEDRWGGATPPGQGDDIVSAATGIGGTDPQTGSLTVTLRLVRTGSSVTGYYSLDGTTFFNAGTFGGVATPGDPEGLGSNTIEAPDNFKVGVYALGGNGGASYAFDSFSATSTPEPASLGILGLAGTLILTRKRRH